MSSPAAPRVSAVIVHFKTPDETVQAALAVARTAPDAEIVVVDNASGDRIDERLAGVVPSARVVLEEQNRGYGAACNRGARETHRPFLLLLNSDANVEPGAVEALVTALDADPLAAAVGPRLSDPDGSLQPSIQRLPTPWRIFCESSGLAFLSGGRGFLRGHAASREDHDRPQRVETLRGAALLVRRTAFEVAGGFDESFFLYAEETDLAARWRARGYRVLFEPAARVAHRGGASGGDALFGQLHRGLVQYAARHHGRAAARFAGVVLRLGAAVRYAASVVTPGERGRARRTRYRAALSRAAPRA
ncbi:MAG: glycosyltransferase family 2 protein [Acidobacteriota bacterium]